MKREIAIGILSFAAFLAVYFCLVVVLKAMVADPTIIFPTIFAISFVGLIFWAFITVLNTPK